MRIAVTATLGLLCAPGLAYAHNGGLDSKTGKAAQQTAKVPEPADKPTKDTTAAPKR